MGADDHAERQPLAAPERGEIDRAQIARGDEIDAGGGAAAQHQPAQPDIGEAGRGIAGEVHGGGNVGGAVLAVLEVDRKPGQVDVRAAQHHLLHRRPVDLDQFRRELKPTQDLGQELLPIDAEGPRHARAAREQIADERRAAGLLEQHGLRVGLERARDLAQPGRAWTPFELVGRKLLDERPQPMPLEIDGGRQRCGSLLHTDGPQAVRTRPTLASSGSSVTWNTIASASASTACACQHGTAMTSPTPRRSSAPPSTLTRALPPTTE